MPATKIQNDRAFAYHFDLQRFPMLIIYGMDHQIVFASVATMAPYTRTP